ncbi:MAG: AsmA-like C-terminal region-containing protein [Bacteroidota bacterium]|nr:AsmA-like C-terminal region-containing protein [Bacteroidota bacterium]
MKKALKVTLIVVAAIFVILLTAPVFFKKPIQNIVEKEINKSINASVKFSDFKLSFIWGFPNVYLAMKDFTIVGKDEFAKDTLMSFKSFSAKVDLISALGMKNIKVISVYLDHPRISAKELKDGKVNWNIMKETGEKETKTSEGKPVDFNANLKKIEIAHAFIKYQNDSTNMSAEINDFNFLLSGDFSSKKTDLKIKTSVEALDFIMSGIKYLKKTKIEVNTEVGADFDQALYTIKNNEIKINELVLGIEGSLKMPKDAYVVDMKFKTQKADFKTLLSMVPAVYMKDFESVKTAGNLKLDGYVKGTYNGKTMPNVGLNLIVENAMFKYPKLPKSANNINVDMKLFYDGVQTDNTTVDINKFHIEMAGNPFDAEMHIKTPISDMNIAGNIEGRINFTSIADVVPLDSMKLKGLLDANLNFQGRMSSIKRNKYEEFKADGTAKLSNFEFSSKDFPQGIKITAANMVFSPKFVDLTSFDSKVGKSDFKLNGKLEKFIPYFFGKDTIIGSLNLTSSLIDVNELMGPAKKPQTTKKDTTPLSLFEVPKNVNFAFNSKIGQVNYDKLKINDIAGAIIIRGGKVMLKNTAMKLLQGSAVMSGQYNTQDIKKPFFDFAMNLKDIDIPSAYTAFNTVEKLAPIAKNCKGQISSDLTITSQMDNHMMPVYNTMSGKGRLISKSIAISNSEALNKIADVIKNNKFRNPTLSDIDVSFEIKNGRVSIKPVDTKLGNYKLNFSGDQGIMDQTLNYVIKAAIPRAELGSAANALVDKLSGSSIAKGLNIKPSDFINANIGLGGTFTKPQIKLLLKDNSQNATQGAKDALKAAADSKIQEAKQQMSQKAKEQADKLIKNAEAEAQKIRDAAKTAADATRKESNAAADKMVNETKNPLAKIAVQKAADKLKKEGEAKAQKIEEEGNTKADALINKAKEEAAKIK